MLYSYPVLVSYASSMEVTLSLTTDDRDARLRRFTSLVRRIGSGCSTPEFREASERVAEALVKDRTPVREDLAMVTILLLDYISKHEAWKWEGPAKKKTVKDAGKDDSAASRPRGAFSDETVDGSEDLPQMDRDKIKRMREVLGLSGGRIVVGPGGRRVLVPGSGRW